MVPVRQLCISLLLAYLIGCDAFDPPDRSVDLEKVIKVHAEPDSILADAFSYTTLLVELPEESTGKLVRLTTDEGTLHPPDDLNSGGSKQMTVRALSGRAKAVLKSGTLVTDAIVTAQVDSFPNFTVVKLKRAYPDDILVSASAPVHSMDSVLVSTIEAELTRGSGTVSRNTLVAFESVRLGSTDKFGMITGSARSDSAGKVQATLDNRRQTGIAVVTVSVTDDEGTSLTRSIEISFE